MESLLVILIIVFAVLQIILFFKIWGMTDNVRKLSSHFCPTRSFKEPTIEIAKALTMGDINKAAQLLSRQLDDYHDILIDKIYVSGLYTTDMAQEKWTSALQKHEAILTQLGLKLDEKYSGFDFNKFTKRKQTLDRYSISEEW